MRSITIALALALALAALAPLAVAQEKGCIELATLAQTEVTDTGPDGKPRTRLAEASTVVPGTTVVWSIRATNVCNQPAGNVVVDSPVPQEMAFVADSATNATFGVSFSLDGQRYGAPSELEVREADGSVRKARADEYRHVRYAMRSALAPGQTVTASHRTVVR
jgi:uncharacterized repeat protein (TIGR01451 family)